MKTAFAIAAAALFAACDKSPISPTPRGPAIVEPPVVAPRAVELGTHTLTITAATECGVGVGEGRLPAEARLRTYSATVRERDSQLEITVASPTISYGFFLGKDEADRVTFNLAWYDDSGEPEPSIIEQLPTSDFLAVRGHATTAGSASRLAGTLRGDLRVFLADAWWRPTARCVSENHQFVLSK